MKRESIRDTQGTCIDCGDVFLAHRSGTKYCPGCSYSRSCLKRRGVKKLEKST